MNILYISKLTGNMWAGPNNSVPAQISAQAQVDNVFWYNISYISKKEWSKLSYYSNLDDFSLKKINALPIPFNNPDLVIFQGVYEYMFCKLVYEIWKNKIPYIIIPRSALTTQAQKKKKIKKNIGNILFFNKFLKQALAIQYLTKDEYIDSGDKWNNKAIIVPNGVDSKDITKIHKESGQIVGLFIGRIDTYQKGLDLLLEACSNIREELIESQCIIKLYGPDRDSSKEGLQRIVMERKLQSIVSIHEGVFDEEKVKIQLEADFFIMTSRFEGHPMGLLEALSYGLPCLVTAGTNMADEISEADAGWTAETNVDSIVKAFKALLNDKRRLAVKGQNALILSKQYNWNTLAKISSKKYRQLLK